MVPELLSPAGSPEAVVAAVQAGAGAIYLGYGAHNARRNAKNFSKEELAAAVSYCHLRDTKVYLTLNTMLTDRELPVAYQTAQEAAELGVDALIVQDLGLVRTLRRLAPDLPLHASTQMSIHSLDGAREAADLGLERVVLARELSRDDIAHITAHTSIETEVFVHGALCMCVSGQCYFSAVVGGRSGNRGLCAQPCRLPYGWRNKADEYPLSLKDSCMAAHLTELSALGVSSLKIEGRMKRAEYVSIVTRIYRALLDEGREPTQEELSILEQAFSRQGFTDGYYSALLGKHMFGIHEDKKEPKELFHAERERYEREDARKIPIAMYAMVRAGEPMGVAAKDDTGRLARVYGAEPEAAIKRAITQEEIRTQLSKTGGTPYEVQDLQVLCEEGLSLPLSAVNALRRAALEELSAQRSAVKEIAFAPYHTGARYENPKAAPELWVTLRRAQQCSEALLQRKPGIVFLPPAEITRELAAQAERYGVPLGMTLPRVCVNHEWKLLREAMDDACALGVTHAMLGNLGFFHECRARGLAMHGDFGLNVANTQTVKQLKRMGLTSLTLSFELQLAQIRDIGKPLPCGIVAYGRLPLMVTENCIVKNHSGSHTCESENALVDRKGARFPVVRSFSCRNEILNSQTLYLADKAGDYARLGLSQLQLLFTTESAHEVAQVLARYQGESGTPPAELTRGLYYRGVK